MFASLIPRACREQIRWVIDNVDRWRNRIELRRQIQQADPRRIVIGAGGTRYHGWVSVQQSDLDLLDPRQWSKFLNNAPLDAILAEHVWEHLSLEQGVAAARTCHRHLREGGYVRCAVPDGLHPSKDYVDRVRPGGSGPGAADHKVLFDYRTLSSVFSNAGFEVTLLEYFDEFGSFHSAPWNPEDGMIDRSVRFDARNKGQSHAYTSLMLDARKPVLC